MTSRPSALALVLSGLALAACGSSAPEPRPSFTTPGEGMVDASSGMPIERYFPLVHGNLWHYETTSDDGERGLLLVRARRTSAIEGELVTPTGARRVAFTSEGVALLGRSVYVLRAPIAVGMSWTGEHGGWTRIEAVGQSVTVPAGRFDGCVVTVEERGGDVPIRYTTTFCPDVGITVLDVEARMGHERAELRSYGPPVNIGPEGTSFTTTP
ncbi:hypothetical protein [Polyangium jinanense]|uniref:Lipoprotein n=1 Tax=Polyangium jinanense TaxID=2829994 RepID=A0A9X3X3M1_9BACT|nr:hypothetical protein [Polyangium jinanense]MDC3954528.1 hypothetical protein [Polyangium jinanense]MDC3980831.1 hypothetical protein [Polyangium jinanense]